MAAPSGGTAAGGDSCFDYRKSVIFASKYDSLYEALFTHNHNALVRADGLHS